MTLTLRKRNHPLSSPRAQKEHLASLEHDFEASLQESGLSPLSARSVATLQINLGRRCNQTCQHCHVDAGPDRPESMSDEVLEACLEWLETGLVSTLDITGGAPEMHPRFRELVTRACTTGVHVIHRCNLTAIMLEPYADIPELLAEHQVEIVASLPYYLPRQTDAQRGEGVFDISLKGLRRLNELGYGDKTSGRVLNLVTNPVGAFLPAPQKSLEADWKRELDTRYGIRFDSLYTMTNMPISRFLEWLEDSGNLSGYMDRLRTAFNPGAAEEVMCRDLISVGYDGFLYDCDFNQMLQIPVGLEKNDPGTPLSIFDSPPRQLLERLSRRVIRTGPHCFGCTAGCGSSCGGATA